jgi:hypothetical protein
LLTYISLALASSSELYIDFISDIFLRKFLFTYILTCFCFFEGELKLFFFFPFDEVEDCFTKEFCPLHELFLEALLLLEPGTASLLIIGGGFSYIELTLAELGFDCTLLVLKDPFPEVADDFLTWAEFCLY